MSDQEVELEVVHEDRPSLDFADNLFHSEIAKTNFMFKTLILCIFVLIIQLLTLFVNHHFKIFKGVTGLFKSITGAVLALALFIGLMQGFSKIFARKVPFNYFIFILSIIFSTLTYLVFEDYIDYKFIGILLSSEMSAY